MKIYDALTLDPGLTRTYVDAGWIDSPTTYKLRHKRAHAKMAFSVYSQNAATPAVFQSTSKVLPAITYTNVGLSFSSPNYVNYQAFFSFDTSLTLGANGTLAAAALTFTVYNNYLPVAALVNTGIFGNIRKLTSLSYSSSVHIATRDISNQIINLEPLYPKIGQVGPFTDTQPSDGFYRGYDGDFSTLTIPLTKTLINTAGDTFLVAISSQTEANVYTASPRYILSEVRGAWIDLVYSQL